MGMDDAPKRTSGRTGRRRLSPAEMALLDPKERKKHARRYGAAATTSSSPLPDPPVWFTPELRTTWVRIIEAAPIGMLTAADHPAVVAYALAILEHDRLARRIAARKTRPRHRLPGNCGCSRQRFAPQPRISDYRSISEPGSPCRHHPRRSLIIHT